MLLTMEKRCEICKLDLYDEHTFQIHLQGRRHLKNTQLYETSIFVSRIPHYISYYDLLKFFTTFGEIANHRFGPNHIIIQFTSKKPVDILLKNSIYFRNVHLNISRRICYDKSAVKDNKNQPETINGTKELTYNNLESIFNVESTFDEQLDAFLNKISISQSEIDRYYEQTCRQLEKIFRNIFPACRTYRFGSTVSGLGFKNCDLDIYMDIGFPISQEKTSSSGHNVELMTVVFSEIKKILYSRSTLFSKVIPIPRARIPIIKFIYIPTKISCDISFKNSLAVYNSQLIKFYLLLDPRLRPSMMILKYWVCNYELKSGKKMPKYALTILFIFYLQQPSVKLAPPIIELKRTCVPKIIEGWQVNFDDTYINQNENNKSIPELLHGFFDFYANYDFKNNVVCTIDGHSYDKKLFAKADNLPDSMDRYKKYLKTDENPIAFPTVKVMCVQDPNQLSYNVTGNIDEKYLENFQKYCIAAAKICVKQAGNNYKELLSSIFSIIIENKVEMTNFKFNIYADNLLQVGLPENFESIMDIEDKSSFIKNNWFDFVLQLIKKFFEKVLHFQINFINLERELKQQKIEVKSDVHSKDQDEIIMHCKGNYCLWRDRKKILHQVLDPSVSRLEKEIKISEKVYEILNQKNKLTQIQIDFECRILKKDESNPHLTLTLTDKNCTNKIFLELAGYITGKLPNTIKKTLIHSQYMKNSLNKIE